MIGLIGRTVYALLCAIAFMVPMEELLRIPVFRTGIFVTAAVAMIISMQYVALRKRIRRIPSVLRLLAVFVLWSLMSVLWSADPLATQAVVITYSSLLLFIWMVWEFISSKHRLLGMLRIYLFGCCSSLGMLFANYMVGISSDMRYSGGGLNPNALALLLNMGVLITVYLAVNTKSSLRFVYWAIIPVSLVGVLLTGSRTGAVTMIISLGMAFILAASTSWKSIFAVVSLMAVSVWAIQAIVPTSLIMRVQEGRDAETFIIRAEQWKAGFDAWREIPILGVGAGAYAAAVAPKGGVPMVAHNTFIEVLVDNGLVGIVLMSVVWGFLARMAWKLPRREGFLWLGALFVWGVASMMGSNDYDKITWLLYAWIMVHSSIICEAVALKQKRNIQMAALGQGAGNLH